MCLEISVLFFLFLCIFYFRLIWEGIVFRIGINFHLHALCLLNLYSDASLCYCCCIFVLLCIFYFYYSFFPFFRILFLTLSISFDLNGKNCLSSIVILFGYSKYIHKYLCNCVCMSI